MSGGAPEFGPDYEFQLAVRLLTSRVSELKVLRTLVAQPHRYNDLAAAVHAEPDETFNRSIRRLLDDGLIEQLGDFSKKPPTRTYRLTAIGINVLFVIARLEPVQNIERIVEQFIRAHAESSA